jgi:hypothetical protein
MTRRRENQAAPVTQAPQARSNGRGWSGGTEGFPARQPFFPLSFNVTPADVLVTTVDAPETFPVRIFYSPVPSNQGHQLYFVFREFYLEF